MRDDGCQFCQGCAAGSYKTGFPTSLSCDVGCSSCPMGWFKESDQTGINNEKDAGVGWNTACTACASCPANLHRPSNDPCMSNGATSGNAAACLPKCANTDSSAANTAQCVCGALNIMCGTDRTGLFCQASESECKGPASCPLPAPNSFGFSVDAGNCCPPNENDCELSSGESCTVTCDSGFEPKSGTSGLYSCEYVFLNFFFLFLFF